MNAAAIRHPNLFIVGAAKSGTTSLAHYLQQHPDIYFPDERRSVEPAYFADHTGVTELQEYLDLFDEANDETILGEKSTAYLFDENAPTRIREFCPHALVIILLRHPVDMAYSFFHHNRRFGLEPIQDFDQALQEEERRANDPVFLQRCRGYYANHLYRRRALFYPQLKRYFDNFDQNQILLLRYDELKNDTLKLCCKVFRFLSVDEDFVPQLNKVNTGRSLRIPVLYQMYFHNSAVQNLVRTLIPERARRAIYDWNQSGNSYQPLNTQNRQKYERLFKKDMDQLYAEFGIDLSCLA